MKVKSQDVGLLIETIISDRDAMRMELDRTKEYANYMAREIQDMRDRIVILENTNYSLIKTS